MRFPRRFPSVKNIVSSMSGDLVALVLGFSWFELNVLLPGVYRGKVCCDSIAYQAIAGGLRSFFHILQHYDYRPLGYPLFLLVHLATVHALGLKYLVDWVDTSLYTAFLISVLAAYCFYNALRYAGLDVNRWVLWALLVHPGLTSYAAIPITDSLSVSQTMLLIACLLRMGTKLDRRNIALATAIGFLSAWIVLTRVSQYPAILLLLIVLIIQTIVSAARSGNWQSLLLPTLALLSFCLLTAPRHLACAARNGSLCFITDGDRGHNLRYSLFAERDGARTYGVVYYDSSHNLVTYSSTVPDPLFLSHFQCIVDPGPQPRSIIECYARNARLLPFYFGKKLIALFDNHHLNAYAAYITAPWQRGYNRLFGLAGFVGYFCGIGIVAVSIARRRLIPGFVPIVAYVLGYTATSLVPSVEARYGFPLVPLSIVALSLWLQWMYHERQMLWPRLLTLAILVSLAVVFIIQTTIWDRHDHRQAAPVPLARFRPTNLEDVFPLFQPSYDCKTHSSRRSI